MKLALQEKNVLQYNLVQQSAALCWWALGLMVVAKELILQFLLTNISSVVFLRIFAWVKFAISEPQFIGKVLGLLSIFANNHRLGIYWF